MDEITAAIDKITEILHDMDDNVINDFGKHFHFDECKSKDDFEWLCLTYRTELSYILLHEAWRINPKKTHALFIEYEHDVVYKAFTQYAEDELYNKFFNPKWPT